MEIFHFGLNFAVSMRNAVTLLRKNFLCCGFGKIYMGIYKKRNLSAVGKSICRFFYGPEKRREIYKGNEEQGMGKSYHTPETGNPMTEEINKNVFNGIS